MQNIKQLEWNGPLTEEAVDLIFMCNNLGFYVSNIEHMENDEYYIKIRFDWLDNSGKLHNDGRKEFEGFIFELNMMIKELHNEEQNGWEIKESHYLKFSHNK